jgi:Fur family transcriptional regulator, ferric uptake regulator
MRSGVYPEFVTKPARTTTSGPPATVDGVIAMLRANGGRATPSRRVILEILFKTDRHLTAEDLTSAVQRRLPDVHPSTIYRNLEELQALGVIDHSHLGHGPATYLLASRSHAHFVCDQCGKQIEASDELFLELTRKAKRQLGFIVDPHHFAILGRCADCGGK